MISEFYTSLKPEKKIAPEPPNLNLQKKCTAVPGWSVNKHPTQRLMANHFVIKNMVSTILIQGIKSTQNDIHFANNINLLYAFNDRNKFLSNLVI